LFAKIAALPEQRILEIGVQFGNSLKTWQDYFEYPIITGIDSVDNGVAIDRVEVIIGDAYTQDMVAQLQDREFDIIIEDGSHIPEDQAFVILNYLKLLSYNGILIIEDIISPDTIRYLKQKALPEGYRYTAVDMTEGNSIVDSRLMIIWRS
jgi:2-polyprenyl-3-methyl-5-hydroxy-6-metoxy-1,4-benzoquinol methylase